MIEVSPNDYQMLKALVEAMRPLGNSWRAIAAATRGRFTENQVYVLADRFGWYTRKGAR
jgi:hypothetical protein